MVKLEEVDDEELNKPQIGPEDDEDWGTDDESDASSITSSIADESLYDRLLALQDIIPPKQRSLLSSTYNTAADWVGKGLHFSGQALWVISTSALLVGLPFALAYQDDQTMAEAEQQMKMQQTANEFLTPGATLQQPGGGAPAKAGL